MKKLGIPSSLKQAIWAALLIVVAAVFGKFGRWPEFGIALAFALYLAITNLIKIRCRDIEDRLDRLEDLITDRSRTKETDGNKEEDTNRSHDRQ